MEKLKSFVRIAIRKKGGVVSTVVANAVAKALIAKSDDVHLKVIDLDSSFWEKSLFQRTGFVKRSCTTGKVEIPEGARKEAELLSHHEIVNYIKKYKIPPSLVMNFDQTPYAPVSSRTLA